MTVQASVTRAAVQAKPARQKGRIDALAQGVLPFLIPLAVFWLWLLNARTGWLPPQVLPAPEAVLAAGRQALVSGQLQTHLGATLLWLVEGYLIAAVAGSAFGIWMGLSAKARDYFYPAFKAISYVPVIGWLPLWLVVLGVGDALKVVLVAQASLSPIVFGVYDGVRGVPGPLIDLGRVLRFSPAQQLWRIVLPSAFPQIWSGIRFGLTKAWLALVGVELLASTQGLGFMLVNARNLYRLDMMFVSVIAIGVIGFALDRLLQAVENRVLRWRPEVEVP